MALCGVATTTVVVVMVGIEKTAFVLEKRGPAPVVAAVEVATFEIVVSTSHPTSLSSGPQTT